MADVEEVSRRRPRAKLSLAVVAALGLGIASLIWVGAARAEGALADADARKAAVKCQALLAKSSNKALETKSKAFNACAAAALVCVQTKAGDLACPAKAAATCTKKLGSAATAAAKAKQKILDNKSCQSLTTAEVLGADGLGFGAIAGPCATDFGIDVCGGLEPVAECLLTSHAVAAGGFTGAVAPRTGELLAALPGAPFPGSAGLPLVPGCGSCSADAAQRKPTEKCSKTLGSAMAGLTDALEGSFDACTLALYACIEGKDGDADCIGKATATCTKQAAKVTKAVAKLGTAVTKACGDLANLRLPAALNLETLADRCAALGVASLDGPTALATCLAADARCTVAGLARSVVPRTAEFDAAAQLGGLTTDLTATCPAVSSLQHARTPSGRAVFGSILKVMKSVKRSVPNAVGVRTTGGKPSSSGGGGGVSKVSGPSRVSFGSIGKFKLKYHGPRSRAGGGSAPVAPPPAIIVAVSRSDILLDDHFELPLLTLPEDGSDVDDEIEIEFGDTIPACAFEISFATVTDGAVSEYESILQVVDDEIVPPSLDLVSRGPAGVQQDGAADSANLAVSADGRFVTFTSLATNLVAPADGNGVSDVFVRDRCIANAVAVEGCTPSTTQENLGPGGGPVVTSAGGHVGISDDGRFVAFDGLVERIGDSLEPFRMITFLKDRCLSNGQPVDLCTVTVTDVTFETETFDNGGFLTWLSSDGRYSAFRSSTVFGQGGIFGIYVADHCVSSAGSVDPFCEPFLERITDGWDGGAISLDASDGLVTRGGRFVAYRTAASDVFPPGDDLNGAVDVFLRDRCIDPLTGLRIEICSTRTSRVNLTVEGSESSGDGPNLVPSNIAVSDDGRYVAFASAASDLLSLGEDTNGQADVFVYDTCIADGIPVDICITRSERVNVGPGGSESNGTLAGSYPLGMSADGRLVVFASDATNLLGPAVTQPNGIFQVFQRDRCLVKGVAVPGCTPTTTLISAAPDGGSGTASSDRPAISPTGSTVVFQSLAPNLLGPSGDTNGVSDVFARDR